jgi:hypothetical protein
MIETMQIERYAREMHGKSLGWEAVGTASFIAPRGRRWVSRDFKGDGRNNSLRTREESRGGKLGAHTLMGTP